MIERWEAHLLDRHGAVKDVLGSVKGGQLEWSQSRAVEGSGSLEIDIPTGLEVDWLTDRIKLVHHKGDDETSMGVWQIAAPSRTHKGARVSTTLELLDGCETLNTPIGWWEVVARNHKPVTTVIREILSRRTDWPWVDVDDDPRKLRASLSWEPQDTWLTVVNDLARTIGYGSLSADRDGVLRVGPYVEPGDRPTVRRYGAGMSKMLDEFTDEAPLWDVPNTVRITVEGTDDSKAIIGTARNRDPASPWSVQNLGREIVLTERAETVGQAEADALARRRLREASQVTRRVTLTHPLDDTWLGDVVNHDPLDVTGPIVNRSVTLGAGPIVQDTVRHIYRGGGSPWT